MTANLKIFEWLDKNYFSKVKLGDVRLVDANGKGAVVVQTPSGMKIIFDVLFVPEISQSHLSVGQLLDKNYAVLFKDKTCEIMDPTGIKLLLVKMNDRSFPSSPLDWKYTDIGAYVSIQDEPYVWHKRLGHINFKSLKLMQNKDLVADVPSINETSNVCGVCRIEKLSKSPFPINQA
ncbi:hypothetical protein RDI58_018404 [Solanum bulbocastanum]|uniref:GAG-pre-integrase domain-containing protein n=1 Tax=Solanum bulbocastanum TaxID=147425 RepID=A0AAN8TBK6_SOLBU